MPTLRKLFYALIFVLTLLVGATAAVVMVTQTAWFKDWLRGYIVRQANRYVNGQVSIERLGGNLFFGVELEKVGISLDGQDLVAVKDLGLKYNVFQLMTTGLSIDEIRLNNPVIYLRRDGDTWSLAKLVKAQAQEADREGPGSPMSIDAIVITDASVVRKGEIESATVNVPKRVDHLDAHLSFKYEPVRYSIAIASLSFRTSEPALQLNALSGGVAVRDDELFLEKVALKTEETSLSVGGAIRHYLTEPIFNLELSSEKVSLPEIARLVPALEGVALQPAFDVKLDGSLDKLGVTMDVRSTAGQVNGRILADLLSPGQSVKGEMSIEHFNLAGVLPTQPKTDLTATAKADLRGETLGDVKGLKGDVSLHSTHLQGAGYIVERLDMDAKIDRRTLEISGRAQAYGIGATAAGRVVLPETSEPIDYAVHGDLKHINLRSLPRTLALPTAPTDVNMGYALRGREAMSGAENTPLTSAERTRRRSLSAELTFEESQLAGARLAKGSIVRATIAGEDLTYETDATIAGLDLQRVGGDFNIAALAEDRLRSRINGHIAARGRGTSLQNLDLSASGELDESSVFGGQIPGLTFTASVVDDSAHLIAHGYFSGFDPASLSGNAALKGQIAGTADVDATVSGLTAGVTIDAVAGDLNLTLEPSKVGDLAIDRAVVDGSYRDRSGGIRRLEIAGLDLSIEAQGPITLADTGESHLTFKADSPRLQEIGALAGVPLEGIGRVDGTLTGNRSELRIDGTLVGNGLKYENNGALSLSTKFSAKIPELAFEQAAVDADSSATFVTVAGQNINQLAAKTTYADRRLTFDATASQPNRSLSAAGAVSVQTDQQELKLQRLGFESSGVRLQLAPDATAVVRYGGNVVNVDNLKMISGDAEIAIDGTFGSPESSLKVIASNVDLATVDALLLREPQLSGRFEATSTITGTADDPRVVGSFDVSNGGFRQFHYDSLRGTFDYTQPGVNLDARLQQNATQWLTAKGYIPVALFKSAGTGGDQPAPAVVADATGDRIDFAVDSSPIDLGVVQGFTTALTDVKGLAEVHLRITGTAADPQPEGTLTVANGGMKVVPTGGDYSHIVARLELQPDRVHIAQVTVLDNHNNALSFSGDVALDERRVGGVQFYVTADDFKILDNKLGDLRVQSRLSVAGDLRAPRVTGYFGLTSGEVNLDRALALVGDSPYATEAANRDTGVAEGTPTAGDTPPASGYAASTIDVAMSVPNDFVVKGSNLQTPGSPIGLGALVVTLGGDLRATKAPGDSLRLVGAINTVRGSYDFQGRRFEILRDGSIRFVGLEDLNPTLDLRTRRLIQGVEARVNVRGTMKEPEIQLSSVPPLEQADILALIVFNQPINQLGEGQQMSLATRAQALATGAVAGQLAQSIGSALNLDTFEIQTAPENGSTAQVTIGQQLGEKLFVRVQQGIGTQSTTNVIVEYDLAKWLRIQTNVMQGANVQQSQFQSVQGSGADLIFFFSY